MDQITFGKFTITPGINGFNDSHNKHSVLDPRLFLKYQLTKKAAVKVATGLYSKRPLYDESTKPWGTERLKPERSIHFVAGAEYYFTDNFYIDVQGYYKKFSDMVVRVDENDPTKFGNEGTGRSYGSEILLRHNMTDNFFAWLSYSWSVAKRKDGKDEPERFFDSDITHNLIGVLSYKLNRYWSFGFKYQYSSGTPYTNLLNVSTMYDIDNDKYSPIYTGGINDNRHASHHQLDFRIDKYWLFDSYVLSTYLDIKNVFHQKHEVDIKYNEDYTAQEKILAVGSKTPLIFVGLKIDF
jgi:outer membrane receptor protein involved in Fe transport